MQLSVILVNYNVCYFLEQCLATLLQAAEGIATEVIVVDNASTDESRTYLPPQFPGVQFIWKEENTGFGRANNQALRICRGDYILFLNPDTLLPRESLSTCLDFFRAHPEAGAVGMRMYDGRVCYLPESKRGLPDPWSAFYKLSGLTALFPRHPRLAHYYLGQLSPGDVQEVEVLAGAFMMVPRKVYEQVGGFDEAFFMYGEDIDLSYRIRQAGYRNYYLPAPGIIHFKGESTVRDLRQTRHFYEAMLIFVRKHYGGKFHFLQRLAIEAAILLRASLATAGRILPRRSGKTDWSHWRAVGDPTGMRELGASAAGTKQAGKVRSPLVICIGRDYDLARVLDQASRQFSAGPLRFHVSGTRSVVGSDDPAGRGECLLVKNLPQNPA